MGNYSFHSYLNDALCLRTVNSVLQGKVSWASYSCSLTVFYLWKRWSGLRHMLGLSQSNLSYYALPVIVGNFYVVYFVVGGMSVDHVT